MIAYFKELLSTLKKIEAHLGRLASTVQPPRRRGHHGKVVVVEQTQSRD